MSPGLSGRSGVPAVDFLFLARSFAILCLSWDIGKTGASQAFATF